MLQRYNIFLETKEKREKNEKPPLIVEFVLPTVLFSLLISIDFTQNRRIFFIQHAATQFQGGRQLPGMGIPILPNQSKTLDLLVLTQLLVVHIHLLLKLLQDRKSVV